MSKVQCWPAFVFAMDMHVQSCLLLATDSGKHSRLFSEEQ